MFRLEPDAKIISRLTGQAVQLHRVIGNYSKCLQVVASTYHVAQNESIPSPFGKDPLKCLKIYSFGRRFSSFLDAGNCQFTFFRR